MRGQVEAWLGPNAQQQAAAGGAGRRYRYLDIFETNRMQTHLAKLPQGALGSFRFHEAEPADGDLPAMRASLSGWFVLNARSLEDAWNQVQQGGYSECTISLHIGSIESREWLWDVANSPQLVIDAIEVSFIRLALQLDPPTEKKRLFWRR
jgi:hypothetical protein